MTRIAVIRILDTRRRREARAWATRMAVVREQLRAQRQTAW